MRPFGYHCRVANPDDQPSERRSLVSKFTIALVTSLLTALLVTTVLPQAQNPAATKRLSQITLDQLSGPSRQLGEEIMKISSVGLAGPYNPMLRSPQMAERLFRLLDYLRFNTSVPRRLNEFAILIQARLWTSQVEWYAHYPLALKAGLAESVAADLKAGRRPAQMQQDEAVVYDFSMELSTTHAVRDETWARARAVMTDQQIMDLIVVSGTYVTVAMLLNAAQEPAPGGIVIEPLR
jgi:4-carboxymuconolactone decarboxylase